MFQANPASAQAPDWEATIRLAFDDPQVASEVEQPMHHEVSCRRDVCRIVAVFPPGRLDRICFEQLGKKLLGEILGLMVAPALSANEIVDGVPVLAA